MVHIGQELHWPPKELELCAVSENEIMAYPVVGPQNNEGVANIASDIMILIQYRGSPCLDLSDRANRDVKGTVMSPRLR